MIICRNNPHNRPMVVFPWGKKNIKAQSSVPGRARGYLLVPLSQNKTHGKNFDPFHRSAAPPTPTRISETKSWTSNKTSCGLNKMNFHLSFFSPTPTPIPSFPQRDPNPKEWSGEVGFPKPGASLPRFASTAGAIPNY